jgi:hypothetical protein
VLRALSLCTCCRHYPGTATGGTTALIRPVMSAFPERVVGSARALAFSRCSQRSLALRPAHSRCHQFVARFTRRLQPFRYLHDCSGCFRLERLPGGTRTHWKAPPFHGAHPLLPFSNFPSGRSDQLVAGVTAAYGPPGTPGITMRILRPQSREASLPPCASVMSARRCLRSAEHEACVLLAEAACSVVVAQSPPVQYVRSKLALRPRYACDWPRRA